MPPLPGLRRLLRRPGPLYVDALRGVDLTVHAGEVFGLVGRNGQGKTTLIKSTCGLLEPTQGSVEVFGLDTLRDTRAIKAVVGLVSADERSFYWRLTGRQNLLFFGRLHGLTDGEVLRRTAELGEQFELRGVLDRRFQEYSSGNKQRLAILRALLPNPPLLLLDEPTRSLDPISAEALREVVGRWAQGSERHTVLITTHNLAEVERLCQRAAILSRGRVIECDRIDRLRAKYARGELVELRLRRPPGDGWIDALQDVQEPQLERDPDGTPVLRFRYAAGGRGLETTVQAVLQADLGLLACHTQHFGLQQVLEQIEASQGAQPS